MLSFDQRHAGLLAPVFALRHDRDFGIGDTQAVRAAIEFCARQGFRVLQILPIHETVGDHSPYNPISSRALSPALLSLTPADVPGLAAEAIAQAAPESWLSKLREGCVSHNSVHPLKLQLLLTAHEVFRSKQSAAEPLALEFAEFQEKEKEWLCSYTLFRLLIREYEGNPDWSEWRPEHANPESAEAWVARHPDRPRLARVREGFAFVQWIADRQWRAVRRHAEEFGIELMGEMSFGVGRCSADVWGNRELFDLEWNIGTRPITYFDTNKDSEQWGQNWGLPAYRWEAHRATNFAWLRERIAREKNYFHVCRLDHLRGYFRTYQFPWAGGARHSEFAQLTVEEARIRAGGRLPRFQPAPDDDPAGAALNDRQGRELIRLLQDAAGGMQLIAEIMGDMPDYMLKALDDLRMPNLTFPQLERAADRSLRPHDKFRPLSLITYANHDHAPLAAYYLHLHEQAMREPNGDAATDLRNLLAFAGWKGAAPAQMNDELLSNLVEALFKTPCFLAVLMTSDLFGTLQRFNLPGSYGAGTWCERLEFSIGSYEHHPVYGPRIARVRELIARSGRNPGEGGCPRPPSVSAPASQRA